MTQPRAFGLPVEGCPFPLRGGVLKEKTYSAEDYPMTQPCAGEPVELYALGELTEADRRRVEEHLAQCPRCRAALETYEAIAARMRSAAPRPSAAKFRSRLRGAVAAAIESERRRARAARVGLAALAAGLAAAVFFWPFPASSGRRVVVAERWRVGPALAFSPASADAFVVAGRRLYFMRRSVDGWRAAAASADSGEMRWVCPSPSCGYLSVGEGSVFCLTRTVGGRPALLALDQATGRVRWRFEAPLAAGFVPLQPARAAKGCVCWAVGERVIALRAADGEPAWTAWLKGEGLCACAPDGQGGLFVVTSRALRRFDLDSGRETWSVSLAGPSGRTSFAPPRLCVAGDALFVAASPQCRRAELLRFDAAARKVAWRRPLPWAQRVLATRQTVYVRARRILALDAATGALRWSRPGQGCGPLTLADGLLHFVDTRGAGRLVALDERTGDVAWQAAGWRSCDAFAKRGRYGYIKTLDGVVHALELPRRT